MTTAREATFQSGRATAVTRREDWPEQLLRFIEARREVPFVWGANDCALFVADAAQAMTDHDFAAGFRGRYKTALGAMKALRSNGDEDLADYLTRVLGAPVAPGLARRGDVVMFEAADGPALGVVVGSGAAAAGPAGITWVPPVRWQQAWRVA